MSAGLAIELKIGDVVEPGWLPLFPARFALEGAYRRSLGWNEGDEGAPSSDASEGDFAAVLAAYVGACWGGDPLELTRHTSTGPEVVVVPPSPAAIRAFGRDLVAFGEAVLDAMARLGHSPADVFEAGQQARRLILLSIPLQAEVEESADFSEGPAAASIESTSR